MALEAGGSDTDRVACGSNAVLDTIAQGTFLAWVYLDTANSIRAFFGKGGDGGPRLIHDGSGGCSLTVPRASSNQQVLDSGSISTAAWVFIAATWDITNGGPKLYRGSLTSPAADVSSTPSDGSGTQTSDASANLTLMNYNEAVPTGLSLDGKMARVMIFNTDLDLRTIHQMQRSPYKHANCVGWWELGLLPPGTGTQRDLSGNGNDGTVTGAVKADHPPLSIPVFHLPRPVNTPTATGQTFHASPVSINFSAVAPSFAQTFNAGTVQATFSVVSSSFAQAWDASPLQATFSPVAPSFAQTWAASPLQATFSIPAATFQQVLNAGAVQATFTVTSSTFIAGTSFNASPVALTLTPVAPTYLQTLNGSPVSVTLTPVGPTFTQQVSVNAVQVTFTVVAATGQTLSIAVLLTLPAQEKILNLLTQSKILTLPE